MIFKIINTYKQCMNKLERLGPHAMITWILGLSGLELYCICLLWRGDGESRQLFASVCFKHDSIPDTTLGPEVPGWITPPCQNQRVHPAEAPAARDVTRIPLSDLNLKLCFCFDRCTSCSLFARCTWQRAERLCLSFAEVDWGWFEKYFALLLCDDYRSLST